MPNTQKLIYTFNVARLPFLPMVKIGDAVLLHTYSSRKCSPIAECRKCSCKYGTGVTIVWRYKACMEHYMHHCKALYLGACLAVSRSVCPCESSVDHSYCRHPTAAPGRPQTKNTWSCPSTNMLLKAVRQSCPQPSHHPVPQKTVSPGQAQCHWLPCQQRHSSMIGSCGL